MKYVRSYLSLNQKDHRWKILLHYQNDIELSFFYESKEIYSAIIVDIIKNMHNYIVLSLSN